MGLDYLSDNLIELRGPVNVATDAAVAETTGTSTVTAKLYDTELDCRLGRYETLLTEDAASGQDTVVVQDGTPFAFLGGDTVLLKQDDGTTLRTTIIGVSGTNNTTIQLLAILSATAKQGSKLTIAIYDSTSTIIGIDNFQGWECGMNMEISLDDRTLIERTVSLINPDAGYLTLSSSLGTDTSAGNIVKRKLGGDLTLASFGTYPASNPVPGDPTWGMRATIEYNHADLKLGMRVRGEITLIDTGPSPDLNLTRKVVGTLTNQ